MDLERIKKNWSISVEPYNEACETYSFNHAGLFLTLVSFLDLFNITRLIVCIYYFTSVTWLSCKSSRGKSWIMGCKVGSNDMIFCCGCFKVNNNISNRNWQRNFRLTLVFVIERTINKLMKNNISGNNNFVWVDIKQFVGLFTWWISNKNTWDFFQNGLSFFKLFK